jgi:hypothetical protein
MGAPKVQGGMTFAERQALLAQEEEMAQARETRQREILDSQEKARLAREEAERSYEQLEESERLAELERMEDEGAQTSQDIEDEGDSDTGIAGLFSALAKGTGFIDGADSSKTTTDRMRPE